METMQIEDEAPGWSGFLSTEEEFRFSPRPNRAAEIHWRPWGVEAFREAESLGRLVLLSVSAVWCHWCHVMDETTYSDPGVIGRINRGFVPVRVDSDRRPDINRRYNQGGWPTTAFLSPGGSVVAGLTYAPPARLAELLDRLGVLFENRRQEIEVEVARQAARTCAPESPEGTAGVEGGIDPRAPENVTASIISAWDRTYGGLGGEPKFPAPGALELALDRYVQNGGEELRSFVVSTLDAMSLGEIFDRVEGGFFRYATARDWSVPHYEKMLSDNAELISVYLAAAVALGREEYREVARKAIDYALSNLLDDSRRGFYGSQDADERYYHRDAEGREGLEPPAVDRTIYTDSTAQMASALVTASAVLDDPGLLEIARAAADFIWREGFRSGRGVCHYFEPAEGFPVLWGTPGDQVYFLKALVDIYQATAETPYLQRAVELGEVIVRQCQAGRGWLGEMPNGGERETDEEQFALSGGRLAGVPPDTPDIAINGCGARTLLTLDALAPGRGFQEAAEAVLGYLAGEYPAYSHFASGYALAVDLLVKGHIEIRLSVGASAAERKELTRAAVAGFCPRKVIRLETVEDYAPSEGDSPLPAAVLCSTGTCLPVAGAADLGLAMASLLAGDSAPEVEGSGLLQAPAGR